MNTSATAAIEASGLGKSFGATEVLRDVDLAVRPGAVVALLGPSGCGKTTLLRTLAGLERLDAGEVRLGGRLVAGPGTHVAPEKRHVGMVFQDWALFPHLRVAQNVAYGLRRAERRGPRVAEVLEMVGLAGMGERQPATLSGGQQQRVALARALAPRPKVLLLDEPFSNLDTALRAQVRSEVHQLLAELEVTTVFVTHDQEEAFVLGDEVAVMYGGRIVQQATPAELYARPVSPWVARFVGDANLVAGDVVDGDVVDGRAVTPVGIVPLDGKPGPGVTGDSGGATVPGVDGAGAAAARAGGAGDDPLPRHRDAGRVQVLLRPEELRLDPVDGAGASGDAVGATATVELHEYYGHDTVYFVRPDGGPTIRVRVGSVPRFHRGDRVVVRYAGPPAVSYPLADVSVAYPDGLAASDAGQPDDGARPAASAGNGDDSPADSKPAPAEASDVTVANPA